jgi:hypothetical protein
VIVCLGPRSHQGTGSLPQVGIRRTRRAVGDRNIVHGCRRRSGGLNVSRFDGQSIYVGAVFTLIGASNSSSIGWEMKISLAFVQR